MLQHLYNTFNSHVHAALLITIARHNNVASKILHGKMLPYWQLYHISKDEAGKDAMAEI